MSSQLSEQELASLMPSELVQHHTVYPIPKHVAVKYGEHWSDPGRYVSNGPYKLVSWRLGDRVIMEKNPLFWDADKVCIDRVSYYPTVDSVSGERRVKRGDPVGEQIIIR